MASGDDAVGFELRGLDDWEDLNFVVSHIKGLFKVFGSLVVLRVFDLLVVFSGDFAVVFCIYEGLDVGLDLIEHFIHVFLDFGLIFEVHEDVLSVALEEFFSVGGHE
jgi:hypothetical protein